MCSQFYVCNENQLKFYFTFTCVEKDIAILFAAAIKREILRSSGLCMTTKSWKGIQARHIWRLSSKQPARKVHRKPSLLVQTSALYGCDEWTEWSAICNSPLDKGESQHVVRYPDVCGRNPAELQLYAILRVKWFKQMYHHLSVSLENIIYA
jgi:hypothetical protein